jgi:hypothetical protein
MSRYASVSLNDTQGKERWLPCSECDGKTCHKVLVSANTLEYLDPAFIDMRQWEQYEIVQCQGCKTISFRKNWQSTGELHENEIGDTELDDHETIYPGRVAGRQRLRGSWDLPPQITSIYNETHSALCNELPVLAGAGIRALIEVVCKDKSASGSDLKERIDNLATMGVLTENGAKFLHSLRIMGNKAVHEVKPHGEEELSIAFDVVEHLLQEVYLLPKKAEKLPH